MVVNKGAKVVVAGNFGPNALNVLSASGIKIFSGFSGMTVKEALAQYKEGKLQEVNAATAVPFGMGMGRGMGRGQGGGWRRDR